MDVIFINHAHGRNLYVDSIAENGVTYAGTSAAFPLNGSHTFAVGGATPTAATQSADTLTLQLSEDARGGNALFVIYLDGRAIMAPDAVSALRSASQSQGFNPQMDGQRDRHPDHRDHRCRAGAAAFQWPVSAVRE